MRRSRRGALVGAALALILGGTTSTPYAPLSAAIGLPSGPPQTSGPLFDGDTPSGGTSIYVPKKHQGKAWTGTFGVQLCTADGVEIELDRIEPDVKLAPLSVRFLLRTARARRDQIWSSPIASIVGGPERLTGSKVPIAGSSVRNVDCAKSAQRFQELLIVMRTSPRGAFVRSLTIHYTYAGVAYAAKVRWTHVLCGSQIRRDLCSRG